MQPTNLDERKGLPETTLLAPAPTPAGATLAAERSPPSGADGVRVAGYEVLAELGRGGMGVVYKARQVALDRLVALKMILAPGQAGGAALARFRTEAEAVAQLQHPHIVQIYQTGEQDGRLFLALEFVPGSSLADKLDGTPLPGRQAARLTELLARAVHAAHQQGIVHRDLKPANVLLARGDGPSAVALGGDEGERYEPKIADFGLAKRLDSESGQTQTGAILGTPSYMAPEQAGGQSKAVGPAADIYALGALLYELLTGRPPFRAESALETVRQVVERDPAAPRLLNPRVDRELETICLKCLEKEPPRRYASAEDLADDLARYLHGEPITARSYNLLDRIGRTLERGQFDEELQGWSAFLFLCAFLLLVGHVLVYAFSGDGPHAVWIPIIRMTLMALIAGVFCVCRRGRVLPATNAERQLYAIWGSYLVAWLLIRNACKGAAARAGVPWDEMALYPLYAILTGFAFLVMGNSYWGRCFTMGIAFFALAVLMPLEPSLAPLEFGVLWAGCLVAVGIHLRAGRSVHGR